jgi:hypothetical protein
LTSTRQASTREFKVQRAHDEHAWNRPHAPYCPWIIPRSSSMPSIRAGIAAKVPSCCLRCSQRCTALFDARGVPRGIAPAAASDGPIQPCMQHLATGSEGISAPASWKVEARCPHTAAMANHANPRSVLPSCLPPSGEDPLARNPLTGDRFTYKHQYIINTHLFDPLFSDNLTV